MSTPIFNIVQNFDDEIFKNAYKELWDESLFKSPFTGPEFYSLLASISYGPIGFTYAKNNKLKLAVFFKKDTSGNYIFLGDGFTDHNLITIHQETKEEEVVTFLELVLKEIEGNIFLKNITNWQFDKTAWELATKNSNRYFESFNAWKNPTYSVEKNTENYSQLFHRNFKKSRLTSYYNKLKSTAGFEFEIDESNRNLDIWIEEFCMNHESRWNLTNTPSEYISKYRRELLKKRITSFGRDQTLIRFSFKLEGRLIGSVICLKCNDYILYSLPSFSLLDDRTHASQVLVCQIGQWAANNEFAIFDFGVGDEPYKMRFANKIELFSRVYIPLNKYNYFHIKSIIEKNIREKKLLKIIYDKFILDLIRHKLIFKLNQINLKINLLKSNLRNDKLFLFKKVRNLFYNKEIIFQFTDKGFIISEGFSVNKITYYQYIDYIEIDGPITLNNRNVLLEQIVTGNKIPFGLYKDDELLSVAIVTQDNDVIDKANIIENSVTHKVLTDCYTATKFRGNGYYPKLIFKLGIKLADENNLVYIYTKEHNLSSLKGIIKAGFERIN